MAQTGYTPISIYYSSTASNTPTAGNLVAGELAINTNDGKLYYKDSAGVVQTIASKSSSAGVFTSVTDSGLTSGRVTYAGTGGLLQDNANLTFNGSSLGVQTVNVNSQLNAAGSATVACSNSDNTNQTYIQNTGATGANGANLLFIQTNRGEVMRINSAGSLGIGVTAPNTLLSVLTSAVQNTISPLITAQSSTTTYAGMYTIRDGAGDQRGLIFQNFTANVGLTEKMRIDSSGIVTMSAYGAGAATFSSAGVISSVSDETWKIKDGTPVNPEAMLQKLEAGYWFYNKEKAPIFGKERQLGFYAQNVHEAIGEEAAPTPEKGKPWGYHDRSVLAITVMSLKNALLTIEELKQKIIALENK